MPINSKFGGNVMGVPVGSPDDDPFTGEWFPSGDSAGGYVRRSLPSEIFLDRIVLPKRADRADGYLPMDTAAKENADRALQRGHRITVGNATGSFTGPPDRVK